jgi:hypothetical protein
MLPGGYVRSLMGGSLVMQAPKAQVVRIPGVGPTIYAIFAGTTLVLVQQATEIPGSNTMAGPYAFMQQAAGGLSTDANSATEAQPVAQARTDSQGRRLYGPYFRHEQTRAEADAIVLSGELWGGSPYNYGATPAVMAYTQPMLGSSGQPALNMVMFWTPVKPQTESIVGAAWYLGLTPGVFEAPNGKAAIPVMATHGP